MRGNEYDRISNKHNALQHVNMILDVMGYIVCNKTVESSAFSTRMIKDVD